MFTGYCNQTIDFLWGIRFNNERPWFEAHKGDYLQYLLQPTRELARRISRLDMPPVAIREPASMKNGMAISVKLLTLE